MRADRRTKLIVALRNFANAFKKEAFKSGRVNTGCTVATCKTHSGTSTVCVCLGILWTILLRLSKEVQLTVCVRKLNVK